MRLALCTSAALRACSAKNLLAAASTVATGRDGYWAVTTVNPTKGTDPHQVFAAIALGTDVPAEDVMIEAKGRKMKIWWKVKPAR
jgi:hypothetical protein